MANQKTFKEHFLNTNSRYLENTTIKNSPVRVVKAVITKMLLKKKNVKELFEENFKFLRAIKDLNTPKLYYDLECHKKCQLSCHILTFPGTL